MAANIFAEEQSAQKQSVNAATGDPLLAEVFDIIMETGQTSVSMFQRRMKIGYRAIGPSYNGFAITTFA